MNQAQGKTKNPHKTAAKQREERWAEKQAQLAALRRIRDDPNATTEQQLTAVQFIIELGRQYH